LGANLDDGLETKDDTSDFTIDDLLLSPSRGFDTNLSTFIFLTSLPLLSAGFRSPFTISYYPTRL